MEGKFKNEIFIKSVFISLSGGFLGILFYLILCQAGDKNLSISKFNYLLFAFLLMFFSILYTFLYIIISGLLAKIKEVRLEDELNKNFIIFCSPLLLIIILPFYFFIYEKLKMINFKMVGYIYMPFNNFIHFLFPGYFLIMIFGFFIIIISFLLIIRFIYDEFRNFSDILINQKIKQYLIILFLFYLFTTTYITIIYPPTGDEPHYLLITKSIIYDRDFNLENNYTNEKFYKDFYPAFLEYENIHNTPDKKGKGIYSIHSPGLPFLISIPYFLGKRLGVQIFMNFLTSLFAIVFFLYVIKMGISKKIAFFVSFWLSLSVPFLINSSLVLTEIPSALIITYSLFVFTKFQYEKNKILFFSGVSFLPFIHPKLVFFSIIFYIFYYYLLAKQKKFSLKKEIFNNLIIFVMLVLFFLYYYSIYGNLAFFSISSIYKSESFYFIFDIKHFIKTFFATLFDRDYGLFIYNPFFIIFIWGIILVIIRKEKEKLLPLFFILPYYILFLFWKDWGGSMTPARQLIPVLPVFAFYVAYFLEKTEFIKTIFFKILITFSFFITYILMIVPAIRYLSGKEKIYEILQKTILAKLLWFFPSFYDNIIQNYFIVTFYIIIILLFLIFYLKKEKIYAD